MAVTEQDFARAEAASAAVRQHGYASAARYDLKTGRLIVSLHNGVELAVPITLLEGLDDVDATALSQIEITPSGLGLHWPMLDVDIYVPALFSGVFGSHAWMAAEMGAKGGRSSSPAKAAAARANGRKGGRPAKRSIT